MTTSRQQILAYIRKHQSATTADISRAMKMTPANARHHLAHLEANGLVEVINQQSGGGKGRPALVYSLSRHLLGDNLDSLVNALLGEWLTDLPAKKQEERLRSLAKKMAQRNPPSTTQNITLTRRLAQTVDRLKTMDYQARWEAGALGPRVILGYCPYARIVGGHPEICKLDAFMLEEMLGFSIRQSAKLQGSDKGLPFCEFLVVMSAENR